MSEKNQLYWWGELGITVISKYAQKPSAYALLGKIERLHTIFNAIK